ncbi:MAG: hypothetical protein PHR35_14625 [Kiritimatiellae bacterium]|nr:hypothetical protein [Kiritimatiellia bacterium]
MNITHSYRIRMMEMIGRRLLTACAWLCLAQILPAETLTVGKDGWQDFTTIYDAYTNTAAKGTAGEGDVIEIYNGTYGDSLYVNVRSRTFRAAPGQTPIWAPTATGANSAAIVNAASNTTVEGLTFSGTNGNDYALLFWSGSIDCRVAKNVILDISNSVAAGVSYYTAGVQNEGGSRNWFVSNRFSRIYSSGSSYAYVPAIYMKSGVGCHVEYNQIDTVNSAGSIPVIAVGAADTWVRYNTISNYTRASGANLYYAIQCSAGNCVIEGNTIYGPTQWGTTSDGIYLGWTAATPTGTIINDNTLIQCREGLFFANMATATNNLICNNRFLNCYYGTQPRPSVLNTFSNNLFVQSGGYTFYTEATYLSSNNWLSGNCFLNYGGPHSGLRLDNLREYWSGNFYATGTAGNQTNGTALIPPVALGADTDTAAVTGFWARAALPANTAGIVVEHPDNRNDQGQTTKLVYDTTPDPTREDNNLCGGVLFDVRALLHDSTNGLSVGRAEGRLARTLRVAHIFAEGTVGCSLRVAYRQNDLPFRGCADSLELYRFNVREYSTRRWQPAVEGNVVNATFTSNDVRRVDGPPDGVLGHYGVDTDQHVVWANLNYSGDFIVTVQPPPTGTKIFIR